MATKTVWRKVFINSKTGQASITLPKKYIKKWIGKFPKEVMIQLPKKRKAKKLW